MLDTLWTTIGDGLGLDADTLNLGQMALRALVVYVLAVFIVRFGEKRFIGKFSAFDVILGFMLGSILAGAITGSPFFPSLAAASVLVALHFAFAKAAFHSDRFGDLVKGHKRKLIADGEIDWEQMRKANISRDDLLGALREEGRLTDPGEVREAWLERSGNVSVIRKDD
jgi:uncharacterized membrane protein YcaP (DUF421 family)